METRARRPPLRGGRRRRQAGSSPKARKGRSTGRAYPGEGDDATRAQAGRRAGGRGRSRAPSRAFVAALSPFPAQYLYLILGHYSVRASSADMEKCQNLPFSAPAEQIYHNAIVYTYDNGAVDVIAADRLLFREPGWEAEGRDGPRPAPREAGKKADGDNMQRSMRRARAKLRRLAMANSFEYFVTLTLDKTRIDRYDPKVIIKALNTWLDNMVRRNGLRYILVPERHKDGALHFHGFFAADRLELTDSGHSDSCGNPVYNLPQWGYGFSTALRLRGEYPRAVGYVCKYIGKQQGVRPMGRWYYSGGRLKEPAKTYTDLDFEDLTARNDSFVFDAPASKIAVIHTKMEVET